MIPDKVKDIVIFPDKNIETNEVVLPHFIVMPKAKQARPKLESEAIKDRPKIEKIDSNNPIEYYSLINDFQISCLN